MQLRQIPAAIIVAFLTLTVTGQNTIGTIQNSAGSLEGLTFFSPFSGSKAYLVDNCGRLINQWDRGTYPGLSAYFLENGLMFRTYKVPPNGPFTSASNAGGLEMVDWENIAVWKYEINSETQLSHHDAVVMPNGNILVLTWQLAYEDELIQLGRDPDEIDPTGLAWSEKIIEIEPIGNSEVNIIWEWQIKDHYVQEFDSTKAGFGEAIKHPELFDINLPELNSSNSHSNFDWNHFNSIDYNETFDQILISVRNSDEIWVLDHSTTTEEARTHSGGRYGKGGDILYRWGNPSAYDRGMVSEQKLFGQHGVNWIRQGLVDDGKIIIFNNGNGRPGTDYSTAEIISPPRDSIGGYILPEVTSFGPAAGDWIYGDDIDARRYSAYLSNTQRLPNGNTLINYGSIGTVLEINTDEEIVWEYVVPLRGDAPLTQGQNATNNGTFRAYKYPIDYPGFNGIDLSPGETIESGTDISDCEVSTAVDNLSPLDKIEMTWLKSDNIMELYLPVPARLKVHLFDISGRVVTHGTCISYPCQIQVLNLMTGIYFLSIVDENGEILTRKIFLHSSE